MTRAIFFSVTLIIVTFAANGQRKVIIDGDKLNLRDSLGGKVILLTSIERGNLNREALWITYDKRPGVDPWGRDSETNFIVYWKDHEVSILGIFVTYDNCRCAKTKSASSPDMYLLHFKISEHDWIKMKELYPDMVSYIRNIH